MKLIRLSDRDIDVLAKIRRRGLSAEFPLQPPSYHNLVVVKPWGYEFLVYQNDLVAAWFLHLDRGHATSMHCHPRKKTALVVLSGQALCNTFFNRNYLDGVDGVVIQSGVFHSTQALSKGGVDLIEIETPVDKTDLARLEDQYGRSGTGYEGLSEMKTDRLERYGYFSCAEPGSGHPHSHRTQRYAIELLHFSNSGPFDENLKRERGEFYSVCRGAISDAAGGVIVGVADLVEGSFLGTFDEVIVAANTLLLRFHHIGE